MEIERKYLIKEMPDIEGKMLHNIEQAYLCKNPALRVRKQDDEYVLTIKGRGLMAREEDNIRIDEAAYEHLKSKADGRVIVKTRYLIPLGKYTVELDVFEGDLKPLVMAEVEFPTYEEAMEFVPPEWFGEEVTEDPRYHNSNMTDESWSLDPS